MASAIAVGLVKRSHKMFIIDQIKLTSLYHALRRVPIGHSISDVNKQESVVNVGC